MNFKTAHTVLSISICTIPAASKFDQLKNLIHELRNSNIKVHFILLCETFLTEAMPSYFHYQVIVSATIVENQEQKVA